MLLLLTFFLASEACTPDPYQVMRSCLVFLQDDLSGVEADPECSYLIQTDASQPKEIRRAYIEFARTRIRRPCRPGLDLECFDNMVDDCILSHYHREAFRAHPQYAQDLSRWWTSTQYTIVIPSVRRPVEYLPDTLSTLKGALAQARRRMNIILVNANTPARDYSLTCGDILNCQVRVPPPVSEELVQEAIRRDQRGDTELYLRWRTRETRHAMFSLQSALDTHTEYIIFIQDDVSIDRDAFENLPTEDVVCLRKDTAYCGAVAYLFSRAFALRLLERMQRDILHKPWDWIIDGVAGGPIPRLRRIKHIGLHSSSGVLRPQ